MIAAVVVADEPVRHRDWEVVVAHAPQLALTGWRYTDQISLSLRPATVDVADNTLRCFAGYLVAAHVDVVGFVDVRRAHIEGFKLFYATHLTVKGVAPARNTIRQRLGMLRSFFDRIIEWDWPDAPARTPIFAVDVPVADDPLPRFLDDAQAARLAAQAAIAQPFDRFVIELLSWTGMRGGELCALAADAVVTLNTTPWLRVPVGKLHNDRSALAWTAPVQAFWSRGSERLRGRRRLRTGRDRGTSVRRVAHRTRSQPRPPDTRRCNRRRWSLFGRRREALQRSSCRPVGDHGC